MKKLLSLFMLLVAIVTGANADNVYKLQLNSEAKEIVNDGDPSTTLSYFDNSAAVEAGKFSFNTKYNGCTYDGVSYTKGLKMEGATVINFTTTSSSSTVVIVQSTSANDGKTIKFDGTELAISSGTTITGGRVYTIEDVEAGEHSVSRGSGESGLFAITVTEAASATTPPVITTDLPEAADVTVGVAEEFSIVATGATSYQWYNGEDAIEGATSATYSYTATAAGTVNLKCVASNTIGSTPSTVCAVTATAPANPPVITTNLEAAYNVIKGQTQELSIVAEDASSYQWYLDGVAVEGETTDTYTFTAGSTIGATNEVYCAATNAAGTTNSATATITTVGRADCEVTNIKFSNGAYGAINNATYGDGTIAVPYIAGTSAPTVEEASINISDGATYVLSGNTLTVTAEDETTSKEYTINAVEITPLTVSADVAETSFTEVPSWVFNLYGYDSTKGLKFAKKVDEASNMRIAKGNTRQYYFIGAAKSLTLTKVGSTRKVNVYVNGTKVISDTNNDALGAITLDETAPCMVMIESNQTGGDGGFSAYAIEAAAAPTEAIEIPEDGVLTYVTQNALDFSTQNGAFKAYVPTDVNAKKTYVITEEVTAVPAGTALLLKGAAGIYDVEIVADAEAPAANIFQVSNGSVTGGDNIFAYSKTNKKFQKVANTVTIPSGKCYLVIEGVGQNALDIDFGEQATAVDAIAEASEAEATPVKVIKNGKLYIGNFNVAGQQVK